MTSKSKFTIICLLILIGIGIVFRPINIVSDKSSIYRVKINDEIVDDPDKIEDIVNVISNYKMRRKVFKVNSYSKLETDYQISLSLEYEQPKHIILGRVNEVYVSRDMEHYIVINFEDLIKELDKVTGFTSTNYLENE